MLMNYQRTISDFSHCKESATCVMLVERPLLSLLIFRMMWFGIGLVQPENDMVVWKGQLNQAAFLHSCEGIRTKIQCSFIAWIPSNCNFTDRIPPY